MAWSRCDSGFGHDDDLDKVPSINCGMRMAYLEVTLTGPDKDLHSGHYGGTLAIPIQTLCDLISGLIDKDGHVTIPGFYWMVELSRKDRSLSAKPRSISKSSKSRWVSRLCVEKGYTPLEGIGIRPCLDVCGIWGGYIGEAKTVLTSVAHAKISMRLVPNQGSAKITRIFKKHLEKIAPKYCRIEVRSRARVGGIPTHSDFVLRRSRLLKAGGGFMASSRFRVVAAAASLCWRICRRSWSGSAADGIRRQRIQSILRTGIICSGSSSPGWSPSPSFMKYYE